jgi:Ca-activated chloride channel family protein
MTGALPRIDDSSCTPDSEAGFGALETAKGPLPLKAMDVKVHITGLLYNLTVVQTFVNTHEEPIEAVYIFPLPPRAAVNAFSMKVGDHTVDGKLMERGMAREDYQKALAAGKRASMAEEDRPNVFTLSVGNLMPGDIAEVTFQLSGLVVLNGDEAEWRFPLVVAPRYIPGTPLGLEPAGLGTSRDTDQVPDASRLNPPILLPGFPNPVRLGIEVELEPVA